VLNASYPRRFTDSGGDGGHEAEGLVMDPTYFLFVFVVASLCAGGITTKLLVAQQKRIRLLQKKVELLLDHFKFPWANYSEHVKTLVQMGKKYEAIRVFQEESGADRREAEKAIEQ
jgi:hypothetical protein